MSGLSGSLLASQGEIPSTDKNRDKNLLQFIATVYVYIQVTQQFSVDT
jgi:hypothetical protein